MRLSTHFTLEEATTSQTASRKGIDNTPDDIELAAMLHAASKMEEVRTLLGHPITVSSWFRSHDLNRAIGGSPTSDHVNGYAIDFSCPQFGTPYEIAKAIEESGIEFSQLIHEFGRWVHISFRPTPNRNKLLTIFTPGKYVPGILTEEECRSHEE